MTIRDMKPLNSYKLKGRAVGCLLAGLLSSAVAQAQQISDGDHHAYIQAVDEYCPAPGQFVNTMPKYTDGDSPAIMAGKCTAIMVANSTGDADNSGLISLGAYGGYVTFHFDHSIANVEGQCDLLILGNAIRNTTSAEPGGMSEPGIVMVSKDTNHNGVADDPWYELAGSADVDSVGKLVFDYQITYTPAPMQNIPWSDNQGTSGTVTRNAYHAQEYFPLWLTGPLTFRGTLLPKNGYHARSGWFLTNFYHYGYVDNKPNSDTEANSFDIGWAVDADRRPVHLDFIDFVRVYCATNQQYPGIGEVSTEVDRAEDLHLEHSLQAIQSALAGITGIRREDATVSGCFGTDGLLRPVPRQGLNILRMSDGSIRKTIINK